MRSAWFLPLGSLACGHGITPHRVPTTTEVEVSTETGVTPSDTEPAPTAHTGVREPTGHTGAPAWSHTAVVDGRADEYGPDESFATSGGTFHLTWDDTTLYLAATHPDVATGGEQHWLLVYLGDGARGSLRGVVMNSQQPDLASPATHLVRRKADGSYDDLLGWLGADWGATEGWLSGGPGSVAEGDSTVELGIPLAGIATEMLVVQAAWVFEGDGFESTYSPLPEGALEDGYDPDFAESAVFDLTSPEAPGVQQGGARPPG